MPAKIRTIENVSRLAVVYIRSALNNPQWTQGLDDYIRGCDLLRTLPKITIPPEALATDEAGLAWGQKVHLPKWEVTDDDFETIRKALKLAFNNKTVPINEVSVSLIATFNLKS